MSESHPLYIATYIDVQLPSMRRGAELVQQYEQATRSDDGNLYIEVVQEMARPSRFVVLEVWKDPSSFEAHENGRKTTAFRSQLQSIHNSPYDQRVHTGLSVDPRAWTTDHHATSVVTHVDVPPTWKDETVPLLKRLAEESRTDEGCIRYDVFQQLAPRTNHFTVFAVWKIRSAFDSHELKPQTRQFREAVGRMLGAPYDERFYTSLNED